MKSIIYRHILNALLLSGVLFLFISCGTEDDSGAGPEAVPKPAPQLIGLEQTGASLHPLLIWHPVGTPDDSISYSLYFGLTSPPKLLAGSLTDTSYQLTPLRPNVTYYWSVAASYVGGGTGRSAVSSFTTRSGITFPVAVGNRWEYRREVVVLDTLVSYYLIAVMSNAPSQPQQPAYKVREYWASLNPVRSDSATTYYQQAEAGLYILAEEGSGSAIPASVSSDLTCRFGGRDYASVDELFASVREPNASAGATRPATDAPKLGLKYPLEVGAKWSVQATDPWPLDKEVTGYNMVTVLGGTYGCFEVTWLHDMDSNGVYDDNIHFVDYVSEEGLVERTILLKDVAVYDPLGNLIGVVDATEKYELVACDLTE